MYLEEQRVDDASLGDASRTVRGAVSGDQGRMSLTTLRPRATRNTTCSNGTARGFSKYAG